MATRGNPKPLDRSHPLPLWAQLEADLRRRVQLGVFDGHFPAEHELVQEYRVSRHTVRDALRRLRADGVVDSARGRGTWLRKPEIEQPLGALYSLFRSVEAMGMEQRSEVRQLDVRTDPSVATRLGRPASTRLVYLERLRLADGEPLALDRAWLPLSFAAPLLDADFTHSGVYDELAHRAGTRLTGGSEIIRAVVPTAEQRRILRIGARIAALSVQRTGCFNTEPVEWRESLVRGDRFSVLAHWTARSGYQMNVGGDTGQR